MSRDGLESENDLDGFFDSFDRLDTHMLRGINPPQSSATASSISPQPTDSESEALIAARPINISSRKRSTHDSYQSCDDRIDESRRKRQRNGNESPSTLQSLWECSRCTLLNAIAVPLCVVCGNARPLSSASSSVAQRTSPSTTVHTSSVIEIPCPSCTFLNDSKHMKKGKCEMCGNRLPAEKQSSPGGPNRHLNCKSALPSSTPTIVVEPPSSPPSVSPSSPSVAAKEGSSVECSSSDDSEEEESISSYSTASSSSSDEDEEDVLDRAVSTESAGGEDHRIVDFLQQLNTFYAPTDLPCAQVPESMKSSGQLQTFQLQGLYWLLSRERRVAALNTTAAASPSISSSLSSSSPVSSSLSTRANNAERSAAVSSSNSSSRKEGFRNFFSVDDGEQVTSSSGIDNVRGGIFADYMGLGKTRTLISLCETTRDRRRRISHVFGSEVVTSATLVVSPTSLVAQWIAEIRECVHPTPKILHYHGYKRKKLSFFQIAEDYDYVFVSYQTLRAEAFPLRSRGRNAVRVPHAGVSLTAAQPISSVPPLNVETPSFPPGAASCPSSSFSSSGCTGNEKRNAPEKGSSPLGHLFMIKWNRVILDEAHYIRNARSKLCRSCFLLSSGARWVVTATPVQNSINDIFPLLQFLHVPLFGNVKWWNAEIIGYLRENLQHPRPTTALRLLFSSLALRRLPSTLINGKPILDLPPLLVESIRVPLSSQEKEFYDSVFSSASEKMQRLTQGANTAASTTSSNTSQRLFQTAFEMLIRCRQACLHPYIVVAALLRIRVALLDDGERRGKGSSDNHNGSPTFPSAWPSPSCTEPPVKKEEEHEKQRKREKELMDFIDKKLIKMLKSTDRERQRIHIDGNEPESRSVVSLASSDFVQELIRAVKEHTLQTQECLICLEEMKAPGILPCGHTFCYDCILHALQVSRRCPTCKHPTALKKVLQVPEDMLLANGSTDRSLSGKLLLSFDQTQVVRFAAGQDISQYVNWPIFFTSKTKELIRQLERIAPGEKCIIFSSFTSYLFYLKHFLDTQTNFRSALLVGSMSLSRKNKVLERFRSPVVSSDEAEDALVGPPTILLATITVCGVGLNLACANHGFIMDPTYNPGVEIQAIHRMHRMGQTNPVKVMKFIADDTVEIKIEELCKLKSSMHGCCFNEDPLHGDSRTSSSSTSGNRLTAEQICMLFS